MDHLLEISILLGLAVVVVIMYLNQNAYQTARQQLQRLGDGYRIRHNVRVYDEKKEKFLIEHVVISRFGLFIVNVEDRNGKIMGEEPDDQWTEEKRGNRETFDNPTRQNLMALRLLREKLNDTDFRIPMYPMVVLGKKADLSEVICESSVIRVTGLAAFIKKFDEEKLSELEFQAISAKID